ncbi:hypothetical protein FACS1894214_3840 [Planctomycetales bacterium]|nr:hypothetical protein FACS1894214_3840 [Planctomycetales bacterium]
MANFFYFDGNGTKQGPVSQEQLKSLAQQGGIRPETQLETDGGHRGTANQISGLFPPPEENPFVNPPIPPQQPVYQQYTVLIPLISAIKELDAYFKWWVFGLVVFIWWCLAMAETGISQGIPIFEQDISFFTFFIGLAGFTVVSVSYSMLLYTLWKQIPPDIAQTTPGKGIGFLFIPFFNLYWQFIAIWGLGQDVNKTLERQGLPKTVNDGLGLAACILSCVSVTPYLGILTGIAGLIINIIYIKGVKDAVITLLQNPSQAAVPPRFE